MCIREERIVNAESFWDALEQSEAAPKVMIWANIECPESRETAKKAMSVHELNLALDDFMQEMRKAWKYDEVPQELNAPDVDDAEREAFKIAAYHVRSVLYRCFEEHGCLCFMEGI
jgi:hypothetical protein